jgi:3-oxoacyl-(acyl-carrier-protein) synthase
VSRAPRVVAIGLVDRRGVAGTGGVCADWPELQVEPPGTGRTFRALFHATDPTFRRLDRSSRALVLAAEAAGLRGLLRDEARDKTAIVVETERGSLDIDLRFARGLGPGPGPVEGALFPYTLASASLGEVALRHRLRGPAICLSIGPGQQGQALEEARRLLDEGEARFALACSVDALCEPCPGAQGALRAVVALLAGAGEAGADVAPWPSQREDPFALLATRARERPA